jgi:RimJ/RimL family protein N-acetyltransferase
MKNFIGKCGANTTFESARFVLRLVAESDAEDLLLCYSDPDAQLIFNSDHCTSDSAYSTLDEMRECVRSWVQAFDTKGFCRFAIIDKGLGKAIGTIEMFGNSGECNVLRLDLPSSYETRDYISELIELANCKFYDAFEVSNIVTKAIPAAAARIAALQNAGYTPFEWNAPNREHFLARE